MHSQYSWSIYRTHHVFLENPRLILWRCQAVDNVTWRGVTAQLRPHRDDRSEWTSPKVPHPHPYTHPSSPQSHPSPFSARGIPLPCHPNTQMWFCRVPTLVCAKTHWVAAPGWKTGIPVIKPEAQKVWTFPMANFNEQKLSRRSA